MAQPGLEKIMEELSEEEQAKIHQYRDLLYCNQEESDPVTDAAALYMMVPSPLYEAYERARNVYTDARIRYRLCRLAVKPGTNELVVLEPSADAANYLRAVQDAFRDWVTTGHKYEVENMLDYVSQVTGRLSSDA